MNAKETSESTLGRWRWEMQTRTSGKAAGDEDSLIFCSMMGMRATPIRQGLVPTSVLAAGTGR